MATDDLYMSWGNKSLSGAGSEQVGGGRCDRHATGALGLQRWGPLPVSVPSVRLTFSHRTHFQA